MHLRMLSIVVFLPPQDVADGFKELCNLIRRQYGNETDFLLKYFEDMYIRRFRRNAPSGEPLFGIEV